MDSLIDLLAFCFLSGMIVWCFYRMESYVDEGNADLEDGMATLHVRIRTLEKEIHSEDWTS